MIWGWIIPGWLKRLAAGVVAALGIIAGSWIAGRREGRKVADANRAKDYVDTRRRIDNADGSSGNRDDDVDWLHDYGDK